MVEPRYTPTATYQVAAARLDLTNATTETPYDLPPNWYPWFATRQGNDLVLLLLREVA